MWRNAVRYSLATGCAVAALLCPAVLRGAPAGAQLVVVIDQAGFRPKTLAEAEEDAARVFRRAEIDLNWENKLATGKKAALDFDGQFLAQHPLLIHLLLREGVNNKPAHLGYTTVNPDGSASASIFCGRIVDLMYDSNQPASMMQILGHVMAHEIGHLLSIVSHSPTGIMRDRWDYTDYRRMAWRELLFTEAESATMRAALQRRERDLGCVVRASSLDMAGYRDPRRP